MVNQPTNFLSVTKHIENEQIVFALLKQGDERAFAKIYERYWTELYNAAYKRMPEKEKCQDIVQSVFADVWLRRDVLEIENLSAFLHTAVRFQVLKQITRNPKQSFMGEAFVAELISPLETDANLLDKEAQNLLHLYISALPEKRRDIFIMHYMEGLSTANIAVKLGISRKTVQNQLTTASHALKLRLTHLFIGIIAFLALLASVK